LGAISESWTGLRPTVAACLLVCSSFAVPARRLRARAALIQPTFMRSFAHRSRPSCLSFDRALLEFFMSIHWPSRQPPTFARSCHLDPLPSRPSSGIACAIQNTTIGVVNTGDPSLPPTLLFEVSYWEYGLGSGYTAHPDVYDRLVNATLRVPEGNVVTLNYDTLLDNRLFMTGGPVSIESYLAPDKNWALIKPHGSIDWGRRVLNAPRGAVGNDPFLARVFASLGDQISLDDEITLRPARSISAMRGFAEGNIPVIDGMPAAFYPALSAPLGEQDELVCPKEHVEYVKEITGHWDPLDVLVIGYSGLDQGVLELLSWGGRSINSLAVVSNSADSAELTAERISAHVRVPDCVCGQRPAIFGDGFAEFVDDGHLGDYVDEILARAATG
jgi:hypothetical protein